ncbi:MAG: diguanylate cyclase [Clostridia bacterium]|nr:diguanylate cyclase [Clostridia bacterium]MBR0408361.1 diguanylate cyclase [Clostridia bacterium]
MSHKSEAVNETLRFPLGDAFEKDVTDFMEAHPDGDAELVIAVIDMDNFLHINENFGYEGGDQVLIDMGRQLAADLPENAAIYRIAGDEFGILFTGMEKEEVFLFMEQKRKSFSVKAPDGEEMTISVGIAAAFDDASRYQELMRKADSAMYRAKYAGRNKVALAREEKMVPKTSHYTSDQLKRLSALSKREGIGEAILLREALDMLLKKYPN